MHIILGEENARKLTNKYTLLELDLIRVEPDADVLQAYCVLEDIPAEDVLRLDEYSRLHQKLVENFRKRNWQYCENVIEHLKGRWGGSVDTFYSEITDRVAKYKDQEPGPEWDGTYEIYNRN
jgi:hypothetical protein